MQFFRSDHRVDLSQLLVSLWVAAIVVFRVVNTILLGRLRLSCKICIRNAQHRVRFHVTHRGGRCDRKKGGGKRWVSQHVSHLTTPLSPIFFDFVWLWKLLPWGNLMQFSKPAGLVGGDNWAKKYENAKLTHNLTQEVMMNKWKILRWKNVGGQFLL